MRRSLTLLLLLATAPAPLAAQRATLAVEEENFRAAPGGLVLGVLRRGVSLAAGELRGRWREATLEGWIWSASVAAAAASGFDLQVSASEGENLREAPQGEVIARLDVGTLLEEQERRGRWVRVRRTGWAWEPSLAVTAEGAGPAAAPPQGVAAEAAPPASGDSASGNASRVTAPAGTILRSAPDGDSVAVLGAPARAEVLSREGSWALVRVEGWVPVQTLSRSGEREEVLRDIGRAELAQAPEAYRGRLVEWELQSISLQRADAVRTEFAEGESYLLARGPAGEAGFVYVAVPEARLTEVRTLAPLQRVRVLGRVRMARSPLTGAPVLELVELLPVPSR